MNYTVIVIADLEFPMSRIYNIVSGKLKRTYKGAQSDEGTLIRVELDPSGIYVTTGFFFLFHSY